MADRRGNRIEGCALACDNSCAGLADILLYFIKVEYRRLYISVAISFPQSAIGTFEMFATDHGIKEESPCSPKTYA